MQTRDAFLALIHVLILLLFFGSGLFFLGLHYAPNLRFYIGHAFLYENTVLIFLGASLLILSFLLLLGFYGLHHKRFFSIRMKQHPLDVDSDIIKTYIQGYWSDAHPSAIGHVQVRILSNQKIEIAAQALNVSDQRAFLEESEREIGKILADILDYDWEFFLTLTE